MAMLLAAGLEITPRGECRWFVTSTARWEALGGPEIAARSRLTKVVAADDLDGMADAALTVCESLGHFLSRQASGGAWSYPLPDFLH